MNWTISIDTAEKIMALLIIGALSLFIFREIKGNE